jgi:hypothetical protein
VPPCSFAWIHLGLKEIDTAFEWLNRAVEVCDQLMMPIKTYGFLAPIRADPRYFALLRRMKLKPCGRIRPLLQPQQPPDDIQCPRRAGLQSLKLVTG